METESAQPQKCSCKCHKHAVAIFVVLLIAGVACWYIHHPNRPQVYPSIDPKPGTICTVQFRRDMLGATSYLTSPTTDNINNTNVSLRGTLVAANREAILLDHLNDESQLQRFWIPKSSILCIQTEVQVPPWQPKKRNRSPWNGLWQKDQTETGE